MPYVTQKNTALWIFPDQAARDQGWVVSEGIAYHGGCFAGVIIAPFDIEPGFTWAIKYKVLQRSSGGVYPIVNGQNGTNQTTTGEFTDTFDVPEDATDLSVQFYSDGEVAIQYVIVYPVLPGNNAVTLGFNTKDNRFTSKYTMYCGFMLKFINDLFAFKDGRLWKQNVNPLRNNFFGEQFKTRIQFICNVEHQKNKLFYNLRLDSKGSWYCPVMTTPATDQFPRGMESNIGSNNFSLIDGKLWADILNDMNDPNFANITPLSLRKAHALFNGRKMQGCYLVIDLEVANTDEVKLASVEVYYIDAERTF